MMVKIRYVIFLWSLCFSSLIYANELQYQLHVDIDTENKILHGNVTITPNEPLLINIEHLENLTIDDTLINVSPEFTSFELVAGIQHKINYQYSLHSNRSYSDENNVVLSGNWYPHISELAKYQLTVSLPEKFKAISEAEQINVIQSGNGFKTYEFIFPHLLDSVTLAASSEYQVKSLDYQGIRIESWFKNGNTALADSYLEHAAEYFKLYQSMLGAYPYKRFTMVESPVASGQSMPGYTLLGSQVIALPFIVKTSLGHEILHQWFGNSVFVDYQHGNWSEGLTNYLADHYYSENNGKDVEYRKNVLSQYASYVKPDSAFPVRKFFSRYNKLSSAIGYGKVAMIFHQLRRMYGDKDFFAALRDFVKQNSFQKASWHDLQRAFENIDGEPLYSYFSDWLGRTDIVNISVEKEAELKMSRGKLLLNFSLSQDHAYHLHLPLVMRFSDGTLQNKLIHFTKEKQAFSIELESPPVSVVIDPEFDIMRSLSDDEKVPQLSWLLSKKDVLVVSKENNINSKPLIQGLGLSESQNVLPQALTFEQIKNNSLVITDMESELVSMLFGKQQALNFDVELRVKRNPYNEDEVIVLTSSKDEAQAKLVSRKLRHYGQYTHLTFNDGKINSKNIKVTSNGIRLFEQEPVSVIQPEKTNTLEKIISQVGDARFILIGEQHDRFEHHLNQLLLIKKLIRSGYKVAIGFEMFQQPYQSALDDYVSGKISESEFLTASEYFNKWRFDYNLYKPVIDYAVKQKLPMIALNIEADISRHVSRKGLYTLEKEQQTQLPDEIDVSDRKYRADLKRVFNLHKSMRSSEMQNFDFFLQSQTLWDEAMAQKASEFIENNPDYIMVILAGNGHLRFRYGIPQRIERVTGDTVITIVQDEVLDKNIADYVLLTQPLAGTSSPAMGVFLNMDLKEKVVVQKVMENSVAENAGLEKADVIVSLDKKPLKTYADLKLALLYADAEKPVSIQILRDGESLTKQLIFKEESDNHIPFVHK